ncbi:hypothetical protein CHUAL_006276 [Chamberlinius hualienensis]
MWVLQFFVLLLPFSIFKINSNAIDTSTLRLVQIIFRHGDRTPIDPFPTDEWKDYWTIGYGELTTRGKQQHYALGQYIRQRYGEYLNDTYWANQVLVNSTDLDRTLNSVASQLAALYPPVGDQIWNPDIAWNPIPIHTRPVPIDLVLDPDSDCPAYNDESDRVFSSPEMQAIDAENAWLYEYITNNTGREVTNIIETGWIYDTIMIEQLYNLTIPSWVVPVYDQMHNISDIGFIWRYKTRLEQRLKAGQILKLIIEHANIRISQSSNYELYLYSSHDTLVSAVLMGLQVFNGIAPPYASAIFFDLHEIDSQYAFQISYYNDTSVEPYVLTIPGCTELCPLNTFTQLLQDIIPVDIFKECNVTLATLSSIYSYRRK